MIHERFTLEPQWKSKKDCVENRNMKRSIRFRFVNWSMHDIGNLSSVIHGLFVHMVDHLVTNLYRFRALE